MATRSSKVKRIFEAIHNLLIDLRDAFSRIVLNFFRRVNQKNPLRFPPSLWQMKEETSEHVNTVVRVFKFVVLPMSIVYVCLNYFFFGEIALDSTLWGVLIFVYSSFLPDLPCIYRRKKDVRVAKELPWYKKYALLLFAPLFIFALLRGTTLLGWSTTETFHNLKSLTIYEAFLFVLGLAFVAPQVSMSAIAKIASLPLYGLIGYLTHLKVDRIF